MSNSGQHRGSPSGPFGMGPQGYLIIAIVILGAAVFAATRMDWASMLVSALVLPIGVLAIIQALSRLRRGGTRDRVSRSGPHQNVDLLTFLARTNPIMFLVFGAVSPGVDDTHYQDLLRSGPYGMGRNGYLIALAIILGPLILAVIITALAGQLPAHSGPRFP